MFTADSIRKTLAWSYTPDAYMVFGLGRIRRRAGGGFEYTGTTTAKTFRDSYLFGSGSNNQFLCQNGKPSSDLQLNSFVAPRVSQNVTYYANGGNFTNPTTGQYTDVDVYVTDTPDQLVQAWLKRRFNGDSVVYTFDQGVTATVYDYHILKDVVIARKIGTGAVPTYTQIEKTGEIGSRVAVGLNFPQAAYIYLISANSYLVSYSPVRSGVNGTPIDLTDRNFVSGYLTSKIFSGRVAVAATNSEGNIVYDYKDITDAMTGYNNGADPYLSLSGNYSDLDMTWSLFDGELRINSKAQFSIDNGPWFTVANDPTKTTRQNWNNRLGDMWVRDYQLFLDGNDVVSSPGFALAADSTSIHIVAP
jgi:hypothetical protein